MRYAELRPSPPLQDLVECFWMIDSDGSPAPADSGAITPDGGIEVVLELGDGVTHAFRGEAPTAYRQFVVGQLDQTFHITYRGVVDLLAIRFRPAGLYRFVDAHVDELTRRLLPLDQVIFKLGAAVDHTIDPSWSFGERVATLESHLLRILAAGRPGDLLVEEVSRLMERLHGRVSMSSLMSRFSLSARQLERRFLRQVGLPPKVLARVLRFRHAMTRLQSGDSNLSELAIDCGYFDQSHMTREFVALAGQTPGSVLVGTD